MQDSKPKILVVEDEPAIAELIEDYLIKENMEAVLLNNGNDVIDKIHDVAPNLVLLDLMLPGKDGMTICREIREFSNIPVIMVTARVEEVDRLLGLEFGADDYICKPFSPREVIARIRAVLRRFSNQPVMNKHGIELMPDSNKLKINQQDIELTVVEFKLFDKLFTNPDRIFSRDQLMEHIYPDHRVVSDRTIDSHIKKLRKKIQQVLPDEDFIKSVYGAGYKYEDME